MANFSQYKPPWYVVICALMSCIMGALYLVSEHMTGVPDSIFHDAFITCMTLFTGSVVIARTKNGQNGQ